MQGTVLLEPVARNTAAAMAIAALAAKPEDLLLFCPSDHHIPDAAAFALVVKQGANRFILPLFTVREILKPRGQEINTVEGRHEVALLRDRIVPVLRMEALLGETASGRATEDSVLVVVEAGPRRVALAVDEVIGKQEVVIKSLGDWMGRVRGVAGGAILGDGSVGIILDLDGLMGREGYGLAA